MKGFVFLYGPEVFLRFVHAGAFVELEKQHELTYAVLKSAELVAKGGTDGGLARGLRNVAWIPFYPERFRRWVELFDVSCIRFRQRSTSFEVRIQESMSNSTLRGARLEKLAQPDVYEGYRRKVERDLGLHPEILSWTLRERPDFFVLPSALLDYVTDDVLQVAEAFAIPTLLLVAGWDNLSSKGLLQHHPTCVGVWGEQTRRHAVQVQGLDPDRVHVVGAPHYEGFASDPPADRSALRRELGVPSKSVLVLFAGTLRQFDETAVLQDIDEFIESEGMAAHVLYRPHPWRFKRVSEGHFFDRSWRHVTMDPEMAATYRSAKDTDAVVREDNFLFRLGHLTRVYQAADAVVSPMSTVLLEALLCGLPAMAVAFGDGKHSWSADKVSRMTHFAELYDVAEVVVCRDRQDLLSNFQNLIHKIGDRALSARLRQRTRELVFRDGRSYAARVAGVVSHMLTDGANVPVYDAAVPMPGRRYRLQTVARRVWQAITSGRRHIVRGPVESMWTWAKPKLKKLAMAALKARAAS